MNISLSRFKVTNFILIFSLIHARAADYLSTFILVSLGATEQNPVLKFFMDTFGVLEGMIITGVIFVTLCAVLGYMTFIKDTYKFQLLMSLVLSIILLISVVVVVGNLAALAYVVGTTVK